MSDNKNKSLALSTMAPLANVPENAPPAPPWVNAPLEKLTVYDICPVNYFSRAWLKGFLKDNNMPFLPLTVKYVVAEYVENPEEKTADWCNVLYFHETTSRLVLNRSRHLMLGDAFGPYVKDWFDRKVVLTVDESDHAPGHLQICVHSAEDTPNAGGDADEINDVLFG